jgi:hypothetical protein
MNQRVLALRFVECGNELRMFLGMGWPRRTIAGASNLLARRRAREGEHTEPEARASRAEAYHHEGGIMLRYHPPPPSFPKEKPPMAWRLERGAQGVVLPKVSWMRTESVSGVKGLTI